MRNWTGAAWRAAWGSVMAAAAVLLCWPPAQAGLLDDLKGGARALTGKGGTAEQRDVLGEMARVAGPLRQELQALQPAPVWQQVLPADAVSLQAVVAPDRLLLGMVQLGSQLAAPESGPLSLIDLRDGRALWQVMPPALPGAAWQLLASRPLLLLAAGNGRQTQLLALDPSDGATRWSRSLTGPVALALDASGSAVVVAEAGRVAALGLADGQARWSRDGVADARAAPQLLQADGGVLVVGPRLVLLDGRSGAVRWQAERSGADAAPAPLALPAGLLVAGADDLRLMAWADGRPLWGPVPLAGTALTLAPGADGDMLWAVARQTRTLRIGAQDVVLAADTVHALSLADGREAWRFSTGRALGSRPLEVGDALWLSEAGSLIRLARRDGTRRGDTALQGAEWFVSLPWPTPDLLLRRGPRLILMRDTGTESVVAAFDAADGRRLWVQSTQSAGIGSPWTLQAELRQGLLGVGAGAVYERRQAWWWQHQLAIAGVYDTPQYRRIESQGLGVGFQLAQALLATSAAVERGLARDAQAALVERKQLELAQVLQNRQRVAGGRYWVRSDATRGDAAVVVDLDTGLRRDLVHSTFNPGMNQYGLRLPGLLLDEDGHTLLAVGAGLDPTRFERYVKFKLGLPFPSLLKYDLRALPWRAVAADNAALVDAAGRGDVAAMGTLLQRGASPDSAPNPTGRNALWQAASNGRTEAVAWLLAHGADARVWPAAANWSPIEIAAMNGHAEIVRQLLLAGAPPGRARERATEMKRAAVLEVLDAAPEPAR